MNVKDSLDKYEKRQQRGQVSIDDIERYRDSSVQSLAALLCSANAQERTIGATIIGDRKLTELTWILCEALRTETHLYPRIGISEALGKMGEQAVVPLIGLLGMIGDNQETSLPLKYFNKKSYPLPRDIAARTLMKIGVLAIPELIKKIANNDGFDTQQAIDALGGIVSKNCHKSALLVMLSALDRYSANEITTWKIVRALSAFQYLETVTCLLTILDTRPEAAIRWEAIRSIGQIGISSPDIRDKLQRYADDYNTEIRTAYKITIAQLS